MTFAQTPMPSMPNPPGQEAQILPLRDIKLPTEPGFWPLAPGWWLLIAVLLILAVWLGVRWYRYRQKKNRWLEINQQLSELEFTYHQNKDQQKLLTGVSVFLRRFVKYQLNQNQASALAGSNWVHYLNKYDPSESFSNYETALTVGVYQQDYEYDVQGLLQATRKFMQQQVMKPPKMPEDKPHTQDLAEQKHV